MKRPLLWSALVVVVLVLILSTRSTAINGTGPTGNSFVNDPCLDPPRTAPPALLIEGTVQSETDIAVLNDADGDAGGRLMVAGYNDSRGLYDPSQGLSGFSYSTTGGDVWIDGGGLPLASATDVYFGQPSVAVHHSSRTFYYVSLYQRAPSPALGFTISVNRGQFAVAPRQVPVESFANTRCEARPELYGQPDRPAEVRERIIWERPVAAVEPSGDGFERPWLYVDQETGVLYVTYTRFGATGATPVELVRSYDGGLTWTPPTVVVPSLGDTFNQGPRAVVTPSGRVVVSWHASRFLGTLEHRIEAAYTDTCRVATDACSFSAPVLVARVNPQSPPPGDNSGDLTLDNIPSIAVDKGRDDGVITAAERVRPGFGNVYITYFNGKTPFSNPLCDASDPEEPFCVPYAPAADILLSRSIDNGATYQSPVKVNDDDAVREDDDEDDEDGEDDDDEDDEDDEDVDYTSHMFPSVQVNQFGEVFVTWLDRRQDDRNLRTDTWGDISTTQGATFGSDGRISTVSADWFVRADYRPNFGTYISSDVIGFTHFVSIWADGRFPAPTKPVTGRLPGRDLTDAATPDTLMGIVRRSAPPAPVFGCTDRTATNYNPLATVDDGTCTYPPPPVFGCTDPKATNFNPLATVDDGSCTYPPPPPPPPPPCVATTFVLAGDSAVSGAPGNVRTFTAGGVSVKASAFSRRESSNAWATAFLGAWATGLGVTDGSESGNDNTHKVDNLGDRHNYVLLRFSQPVTLTQAYLDSIGADSDATIWIGTIPGAFDASITLSDAVLAGLGAPEDNTTTSTQARWATFNAARESGNVVVIAAQISSTNDAFKVSQLKTVCTPPPPPPPPPGFPNDGLFVIGDRANHAVGARVNFWGAHWPKNNPTTTGGSSPGAFKGFAVGNATPTCGGMWTDRPGNSSKPPAQLPEFMAVVVTSDVNKKGSMISGTITKIVVVRVEPGYAPAPGHGGYGQVVSVLCTATPATVAVSFPSDQSTFTGVHAFKARLEGRSLTSYQMYWQVDGDRENAMYDSQAGHKQAMVDVRSWSWRGSGPYAITFVARDASRNVIARRTVSIRIAR